MRSSSAVLGILTALIWIEPTAAQNQPIGKQATVVLNAVVEGMPRGEKQEVRVLSGTLEPGERTVLHTHPFPVTVYVVNGEFTLEVEGQKTATIGAGQAFSEPANVKITGYNRGATRTSVVVFYVSDPNAPFLNRVE